jgi:hypothetical protein
MHSGTRNRTTMIFLWTAPEEKPLRKRGGLQIGMETDAVLE